MPEPFPPDPADDAWMALAIEEARKGLGLTSPNPAVGAVIVKNGEVIGKGWHRRAGEPHAEIEALRDANERSPNAVLGATIYVTLEPCSTHGRTPPCTEAILAAGLARVVYGASDPNPGHCGRADDLLRARGVQVASGVLQKECEKLIQPFAKWITTGLPYVIAKAGLSLDGKITRPTGEPQWITSEQARAHAQTTRRQVDAILVGAETVRKDNPRLTLRGEQLPSDKKQPWRVVMTRSGNLPAEVHLFTDEFKDRTLVMTNQNLSEVLADLGRRGVVSVLIEGGSQILSQAFAQQLVDEVQWYFAPRICGGGLAVVSGLDLAKSIALKDVRTEVIGDNVCFIGRPEWES
ncbi:MAG: bifunctional diaminohydroxyphosphoribosylaminopyrimidine deaminase/5-amino-6-(5-phosphoribosylamino)uracil reductase RibD [Verrucomicrobiaceae bacterium]|nr:bifunctional diaminohydroxyphosphoribosylaminopyrimidine deaminase/5-amino-6-(5-phosphoribosylamino)uracil reductase RibD [Verrucomicrobiaceae bacterium]